MSWFESPPVSELGNPPIPELKIPLCPWTCLKFRNEIPSILTLGSSTPAQETLFSTQYFDTPHPGRGSPYPVSLPINPWGLLCGVPLWYSLAPNYQDTFPLRVATFPLSVSLRAATVSDQSYSPYNEPSSFWCASPSPVPQFFLHSPLYECTPDLVSRVTVIGRGVLWELYSLQGKPHNGLIQLDKGFRRGCCLTSFSALCQVKVLASGGCSKQDYVLETRHSPWQMMFEIWNTLPLEL